MKEKEAHSRDVKWRIAVIVEVIVCYLAILAVVSYAKGPERYHILKDDPLLTAADFATFSGEEAGSGSLVVENDEPGHAVGWQGKVDLTKLGRLNVSFRLDCPAEYAGGTLFVDLYNYEAGYDDPEQEWVQTLLAGSNDVHCNLIPGEGAPDTALLRLFTLDVIDCEIVDLAVCKEEVLPKVPSGLWVGVGVCFILLAGTVVTALLLRIGIISWTFPSGRCAQKEGDGVNLKKEASEKNTDDIQRQVKTLDGSSAVSNYETVCPDDVEEDTPDKSPVPGAERVDYEEFQRALGYANANYVVPSFSVMDPRESKTLMNRILCKISKCLLQPIVDKQNSLNTMFVRCLNAFSWLSEEVHHRLVGHDEELQQARSWADAQERQVRELVVQSERYREELDGLHAESLQRHESILQEFAHMQEQLECNDELRQNRADAQERQVRELVVQSERYREELDGLHAESLQRHESILQEFAHMQEQLECNDELRQNRADAQERQVRELVVQSERYREELDGLHAESLQRHESILQEFAHMQEQLECNDELRQNRADALERQVRELVAQNATQCEKLDGLQVETSQQKEGLRTQLDALARDMTELRELLGRQADKADELQRDVDSIRDVDASIFDPKNRHRFERYSQAGEDSIIAYVFRTLGYSLNSVSYLDLGANHARDLSNTYYFYQHGSSGVLVEANPDLIPELKLLRRRDIILNRCVANTDDKEVEFYITNFDGLSSSDRISVEHASGVNEMIELAQTVQVKTISVQSILERYFNRPPALLNIDVEGCEMDILRSYDFERYRPFVVVAEVIPYDKNLVVGVKNRDIVEFLQQNGYIEYAFTGINSIFIDARKLEQLRKGEVRGLLPRMHINEQACNGDYGICMRPEGLIYGPYVECEAGTYVLTVEIVILDESVPTCLNVTADFGNETLTKYSLKNGPNMFALDMLQAKKNVEFVIHNSTNDDIFLSEIDLKKEIPEE